MLEQTGPAKEPGEEENGSARRPYGAEALGEPVGRGAGPAFPADEPGLYQGL